MSVFRNKQLLALIGIVLLLVILPIVIIVQRQQTQTESGAQQTTTLYFSPDTSQTALQIAPQENFSLDIMMNPGQNLVTLVKVDLSFDPTKIGYNGASAFVPNTTAFPEIVEGPVYGSNKFTVTMSIGNDPTRAVNAVTKVGTLNLKALATTGATPTEIVFTNLSQVLSAAPTDQASENVLAGTTPARIAIISNSPTPTPDTGGYQIYGRVFMDTNLDGKRQNTEDPVPANYGYNISITKDGVPFQVTHNDNGNGQYQVLDAPAGNYVVTYTNPPTSGTTFPTGNPPSYTVTLGSAFCSITPVGGDGHCFNGNALDVNFGVVPPPPSPTPTVTPTVTPSAFTISGVFFEDFNDNGVIDLGEINDRPLRPQIELRKSDGTLVDRVSNEGVTGLYQFTNIPPGNYVISVVGSYGTTTYHISTPQPFPYPITLGPSKTVNIGIVQDAAPTPTNTPIPPTPTRTPTPTSLPTNTPAPTNTPVPQGVSIRFTAFLHGIGSAGDSKNPNDSTLSNKNPLHPTRTVTVEAFNALNQKVAQGSGTLTYNAQAGTFQGTADFGTSLTSGTYLVKVKTDQYLRKDFAGIQTLTAGTAPNDLPTVTMIVGDVNGDNALDILDYNLILGCYSDLLPAKACNATLKLQTDINDDGNVNQVDYNLFIRELSFQQGN